MPQYVIGSASARNVCGWTARNLRRESCLSYNWRWPIAKCVFAPASLRPQSRPRCTCPCRVPHPCGEIRSVLPAQRAEYTGCLMLDEAHRVAKLRSMQGPDICRTKFEAEVTFAVKPLAWPRLQQNAGLWGPWRAGVDANSGFKFRESQTTALPQPIQRITAQSHLGSIMRLDLPTFC